MKKNKSTTPSTFSCSRTLLRIQNVPARPMAVLQGERHVDSSQSQHTEGEAAGPTTNNGSIDGRHSL